MGNRNSFTSTSAGAVTETAVGLENLVLKTGYADGAVIYALFGTNDGTIVLKHIFEDGTEIAYQTVSCSAGILSVINLTHKLPHIKVYYTHAGAGAVNIETVTSLGQI